ncbi:hypothetical protein DSLASN_11850 [Desulfoluna limicola]|uniref:LVIVD repeat protein n=1 Tax=Desulfoluna limicola TaxID=2810562 RepID=A0ABM7PEQ5_9BACT|nr:hypothetical protein DSLASN_11850 [Desulfoluna limicola]
MIWAIGDTIQVLKGGDLSEVLTFRVNTFSAIFDMYYCDEAGSETLYVAAGAGNKEKATGGFQVFNLSDLSASPMNPVGTLFEVPDNPGSIKISDTETQALPQVNALGIGYASNTIFLADNNFGLRVIDVTNATTPEEILLSNPTNGYKSGYKQGDINGTYTTTGGYTNAEAITFTETGKPDKTYAFVLDYYYGLKVFDVTDSAAIAEPVVKNMQTDFLYGSAALVSDVHPVIGSDNRLYTYVTAMDQYAEESVMAKLSILSDTNELTEGSIINIGRIETPGGATGVTAPNENTAYVADNHEGLQIIDASGTPAPGEVLDFKVKGSYTSQAKGAYSVAHLDNTLYMGTVESGLMKLDVSDSSAPSFKASTESAVHGDDIVFADGFTYLLDSTRGLRIFDTSSFSGPTLTGFLAISGTAYDIAVNNNIALIANGSEGLTLVDLADKSGPSLIGTTPTPGTSRSVAWFESGSKSYACVAEGTSGSRLIDVTDPENPGTPITIDQSGFTAGTDSAVDVIENRAYIADIRGLKIADLNDPLTPFVIAEKVTTGNAVAIYVFRQNTSVYAIIADDAEGIRIENVTDPLNIPSTVATIPPPETGSYLDLDMEGALLFAASGKGGFTLFSLADPAHPEELASWATQSSTKAVSAFSTAEEDVYVVAADTYNGLSINQVYDSGDTDLADSLTSSSSSSGCFIGAAGSALF